MSPDDLDACTAAAGAPLAGDAVPPGEDGADNEVRLARRLWSDARALRAVRGLGLADATIRRFRLGLKEPYLSRSSGLLTQRALAFPVLAADGARAGRWAFLNMDGVTANAPHPIGWGSGPARACYSRPVTVGSTVLVVPGPVDMWLVWQAVGDAFGSLVVICPSQPGAAPPEWRDARYWRGFERVVLGLSSAADEEDLAASIGRAADVALHRCRPPAGETWADLVRTGGSPAEIRAIVTEAVTWCPAARSSEAGPPIVGDFQADPVAIDGALVGGRMHYPVTVERRELEEQGGAGPAVVQRYVTRILRSDGAMLDVERLPAPRGTPAAGRVLALSDGTRIVSAPRPGRFGTWRFSSIDAFVRARAEGAPPRHRPLGRLVADVEAHLRASVWLPFPEDYALAALFAAATFVHRAFDAFPILLLNGAKGSGKSEAGQALATICCNGLVAGRVTPAGLVRVLADSGGTVVLDDLEEIGSARAGDELVQILKTSYKAATARRIVPGRDGRVDVTDYYAPKIVTNVGGADAVLLSRMLAVRTRPMPDDAGLADDLIDVADLRDELHTWAMCEAAVVSPIYVPLREAARERRAEIAAPLRALATMVGDERLSARLETALAAEPDLVAEPVEVVLGRALRRLVEEDGVREIAMPRLLMEMAIAARGPFTAPSAETLGRLLIAAGARAGDRTVDRRRLHGEVTRVYALAPAFLATLRVADGPVPDPFSFCSGACAVCRYDAVCDAAAPGLRDAKVSRIGR